MPIRGDAGLRSAAFPCQTRQGSPGWRYLSVSANAFTSAALSGWPKAWLANQSTESLLSGLQHGVCGTQSSADHVGEETCCPRLAGQKVKRPRRLLGKISVREPPPWRGVSKKNHPTMDSPSLTAGMPS